jgi:hypothetical protein
VRAVRGLADRELANTADPLDPRNRRVSILVVAHVSDFAALSSETKMPGAEPAAAAEPVAQASEKPRR